MDKIPFYDKNLFVSVSLKNTLIDPHQTRFQKLGRSAIDLKWKTKVYFLRKKENISFLLLGGAGTEEARGGEK